PAGGGGVGRPDPEPRRAVSRFLQGARRPAGGFRLAGGDLGDPRPRTAASPRVASPGARPRGLRLGRGTELRPRGGGAVRSRLSVIGGAGGAGGVPAGRRLFPGLSRSGPSGTD